MHTCFLRPLQYMIPTVVATITTPTMAAMTPIRTTIDKERAVSSKLRISCRS